MIDYKTRTNGRQACQFLALPVVALGAASLLMGGCAEKSAEADARIAPPLVPVMSVEFGQEAPRSYTGMVKAKVESNLGFRVQGKIVERLVDTGQFVKRGQILFRLDRTDLAHTMNARQESVLAQRGSIESKKGASESARAHLIQAEADEKRYRNALSVGVVTEQAYDQYKAALDSAKAEFQATQAEIKSAQDQASSLLAQQKVAENESDYATLISDTDGVVSEVLAEPGQVVAVGQAVVRIAREGPREASVSLPETVRPKIGSFARAEIFDSHSAICQAQLRQLSESADSATRTYDARYVLSGEAAKAPLGATVTVTLNSVTAAKSLENPGKVVVPLTALIDKGPGPGVWVVDPSTSMVHLKPIAIAVLGKEDALVTSGLHSGEKFVAQGAHLLHENDKIRMKSVTKDSGPAPLTTPPHESQ